MVPRFGHTAVARNLVKRRLRELARVYLLPTRLPINVVVKIRPDAYKASFDSLAREIQSAVQQLHVWVMANTQTGNQHDGNTDAT